MVTIPVRHDLIRLCALGAVDERSVRRAYRGEPTRSTTMARVRAAAAALGLPEPPPPAPREAGLAPLRPDEGE